MKLFVRKILLNYDKEIPYAVEIETEEFKEDDNIIRIRAVIMVERDTQKESSSDIKVLL